jgi:uncharacterized protein YndB with AHSA1/START domain
VNEAKENIMTSTSNVITSTSSSRKSEPEVVINRFFDAPRDLVFRAWTTAESLRQWYAPTGCSIDVYELDLRPGGVFRHCIRTPAKECMCKGVYLEVVAPERLVYTLSFCDDKGNRLEPADVGMNHEWPSETTVTVTFEERDGGTMVRLHQSVSEALAKQTGAHPSWLQMLDRLAEQLR